MRRVQLKKTGYSVYPWGPESTLNGVQYLPAATAFRNAVEYGDVFAAKELVEKAREACPELFDTRERGDLTPSQVADRLNRGGRHPALGINKFRLEWFPTQRCYCVIDAAELVDRRDVAHMMERAARSASRIVTEALQMANHLIRALPEEDQQQFVAEYKKQMGELDIIKRWGQNDQLDLVDAVEETTGLKLTNGNGHQLEDEPKLTPTTSKE